MYRAFYIKLTIPMSITFIYFLWNWNHTCMRVALGSYFIWTYVYARSRVWFKNKVSNFNNWPYTEGTFCTKYILTVSSQNLNRLYYFVSVSLLFLLVYRVKGFRSRLHYKPEWMSLIISTNDRIKISGFVGILYYIKLDSYLLMWLWNIQKYINTWNTILTTIYSLFYLCVVFPTSFPLT